MTQEPWQGNDRATAPGVESAPAENSTGSNGRPSVRRRFRLKSRNGLIVMGVVSALVMGAAFYLWYTGRYEATDDAQIDGHIDPVSARVAGHINQVFVDNGEEVKAGALLATIDPADYQNAYDHAKAALAQAEADNQAARLAVGIAAAHTTDRLAEARAGLNVATSSIATSRQAFKVAQAEQNQAQAQEALAHKNLKRAERLVAQKVISRQSYDQYQTADRTAAAALAASRDQVVAAAKRLDQAKALLVQAQADLQDAESGPDQVAAARAKAQSTAAAVAKARAAMAQAQLNLQYTRITAPADGVIGNKSAELGQNVAPGQVLMDLVQVRDVWVTADFKETQLRRMRAGQAVTIHVDAYDKDYKGRLASIGGATGEQFSLFPPENATGNYVKVVQRMPVKIVFDAGENARHRLRPGMSVEPRVWIQ